MNTPPPDVSATLLRITVFDTTVPAEPVSIVTAPPSYAILESKTQKSSKTLKLNHMSTPPALLCSAVAVFDLKMQE
jgi:hypothetical protein